VLADQADQRDHADLAVDVDGGAVGQFSDLLNVRNNGVPARSTTSIGEAVILVIRGKLAAQRGPPEN
jgi:hypothetical protein